MPTSLATFEPAFRERLLDLVYGQWHQLGAPFSTVTSDSTEVIDPEALLWCSFEFLPSEPRLAETVVEWLHAYGDQLIRQRLKKRATSDDPRTRIWRALDTKHRPVLEEPAAVIHEPEPSEGIAAFLERTARHAQRSSPSDFRIGERIAGPSTVLLRARDLLGSDVRHFLLIYLLANPSGGKLRNVQEWSGYTYRGISEAATRWQAAQVAVIEHGYCYLSETGPWRSLLHLRGGRITLVNWFRVFDECIRLLRVLAKAQRKDFAWDNPVLVSHRRDACRVLSSPLVDGTKGDAASIARLRDLFPKEDRTRVVAK